VGRRNLHRSHLLGIIPELSSVKDSEKYSMVMDNRQSPGTEAFLSIYSSVKIHSKLDFPKSILVTSTIPGEGKTLVSCNLAGSFARHAKSTLLIDCDLRRPDAAPALPAEQ
jgi:succinoglycan biosynthesis transport protein ExoP